MASWSTADSRAQIKSDWSDNRYYADAEQWLARFWTPGSIFLKGFEYLDLTNVVELACGHGRHTAQIVDRVGHIILTDINETNISACRERFAGRPNVSFLVGSGSDFAGIPDNSQTAIFSYDAMVHFELEDVRSYIIDAWRILKPGGKALFHYSNNMASPGRSYHEMTHWRNFGSEAVFRHLAMRHRFHIFGSEVIDWAGASAIDAITLIEKHD